MLKKSRILLFLHFEKSVLQVSINQKKMANNEKLSHPYLLQADDLTKEDIFTIFNKARFFLDNHVPGEKFNFLKGRTVALAFFEASTRTKLSFELAAKWQSADVLSFQSSSSSLTKGESLIDTLRTIEAMGVDMYVVRHGCSGVPIFLQQNTKGVIINAGDGRHEHPTQSLLDSFTIYNHFGKIEGLKVCIVGDILHSRVARSNITMLKTLGAEVKLFSPGTLVPQRRFIEHLDFVETIDEATDWADVVMVLRLQRERMDSGLLPTIREFSNYYGVDMNHFCKKPELVLLHPGPVNYGIELDYRISQYPNVLIQTQVTHGVYIRMAVLALLAN